MLGRVIHARRLGRVRTVSVLLPLLLLLALLPGGGPAPAGREHAEQLAPVASVNRLRVVAISLDGLNPRAISILGRDRLPHLYRMLSEGAWTMNARSQVELTTTLPNHTSMVTGRRVDAASGGHGVTWNTHLPGTTVRNAAGHDVSSVFRVVRAAGGATTLFSTKTKLSLFSRSWPNAITRTVIRTDADGTLTALFRRDLLAHRRSFALLHLGLADRVGHDAGWLSPAYLAAVERLDRLVGSVLATIRTTWRLRRSTMVVLTADHGGVPGSTEHEDPTHLDDYRVPFVVWGRGVAHRDLYRLNPDRLEPGRSQPGFGGSQPIRNGDLANLATDVLGLGPVPGSLWNRRQDLDWR